MHANDIHDAHVIVKAPCVGSAKVFEMRCASDAHQNVGSAGGPACSVCLTMASLKFVLHLIFCRLVLDFSEVPGPGVVIRFDWRP